MLKPTKNNVLNATFPKCMLLLDLHMQHLFILSETGITYNLGETWYLNKIMVKKVQEKSVVYLTVSLFPHKHTHIFMYVYIYNLNSIF